MSFFLIAPNDQSIFYLGQLFGNVGNVLAGTGPALLGKMFQAFNTALLILGSAIVVYTTVVSVLSTAHEGEFLGKKFHGLWMPIRTVMGIATLMPTSSGYCVIQLIMMWIIIQGIGAADTIWNIAVNYFEAGGAVSTPAPSSYLTGNQYAGFQALFNDLTCQSMLKKTICPNPPSNWWTSWCSGPTDFSSVVANNCNPTSASCSYPMGPIGMCDTLSWNPQNPTDAAKYTAYQSIIPSMTQVADYFADQVVAYNNYAANNGPQPTWLQANPNIPQDVSALGNYFWNNVIYPYTGSNFIRDDVNLYMGYVLNASTTSSASNAPGKIIGSAEAGPLAPVTMLTTGLSSLTIDTTKTLETAKSNGWIFAGAYYYFIASMTNSVVKSNIANATPSITNTVVTSQTNTQAVNAFLPAQQAAVVNNAILIAAGIGSAAKQAQDTGGGEGTFSGAGGVQQHNVVSDVFVGIFSADLSSALLGGFMAALNPPSSLTSEAPTNPLVNLQAFGEVIILIVEAVFFALLVGLFVVGTATGVMSSVQPLPWAVAEVSMYIIPVALFVLLALLMFGASLAIYLPLVPYIIFSMAAIGWFIATIETMIAAPIVAIGILSPGGQNELLGHAAPAIMLILNVFLRPMLLVFGMMAGYFLSYVVVTFINAAYLNVVRQIYTGPGLVETVLFIATYCAIIITSLNKCFQLIPQIPDQILRWLSGGQQAQFGGGAEKAEGEIKGEFGSSAGQVKSGAAQASKAIQTKMAKGKSGGASIK